MTKAKSHGRAVLLYFVLFFGAIFAVNTVFVYTALHTNTGTVTENAYENGLGYNKILSAMKTQPAFREQAALDNGVFRWSIDDDKGQPVTKAQARVTFVRPVKDGNDFDLDLQEISPGKYEAKPAFPAKGLWTAQLDATWNNRQYQTSQNIIVK